MLGFTAIRLAERQGFPRDPDSNALLESFLIHVRDFLWGERGRHEMDAFAPDFCEEERWEAERGDVSPDLAELDARHT